MNDMLIGCGQITWRGEPAEKALADIAQAGYAGAPAGPQPGQNTQDVLAAFHKHGLQPAPGYLGADFWDPAQEAAILQRAEAHADFAQEAGVSELYVAAGGFDGYVTARGLTRRQVSGHVQPADAMTDAEYDQFARVLNRVGAITLERGVKSCFHNHVGSVIETRDEIDRLLELADPDVIFLGPDTGHLEWGGADSVQFFRDYAERIQTVHVKDVNRAVLAEGVAAEWDYRTFSEQGIWTELGRGFIDFPTLFDILHDAGFSGWIIVETDVTQLPTALESAQVSREYLRGLGY